jgi:hypothetical protein
VNLPKHFVTTVARSSETLLNFNLRKSSQVTADNAFNIDEIELQNTQTIFKNDTQSSTPFCSGIRVVKSSVLPIIVCVLLFFA